MNTFKNIMEKLYKGEQLNHYEIKTVRVALDIWIG